jgi:pimeloyl-ACP methyl ester carboxylesterase
LIRAVAAIVGMLAVVLAAVSGAAGRGDWDGCTPKRGDVTFRAPDGTKLAGHVFGRGRTAVVLAHQSDGMLCQWMPYATRLARLGYLTLAFDFRNAGSSQTRHYPANIRYGGDVAGAVAEVRRRGARKVFVVGASLGGSAALQAAANVRPPVAAVVSVSGAADLSNALKSVRSLTAPVLYLAGSGDVDFAKDARRLYDATPKAHRAITILDDSRHGTSLVARNAKARQLIESFLRSH